MCDNIDKEDIRSLIDFLSQEEIPKLTNGPKVKEFEERWGQWLGTKYNIMLNSGASANELTLLALKYLYGTGDIILPPLTWISDVSAVTFNGFNPVFCDINLKNLSEGVPFLTFLHAVALTPFLLVFGRPQSWRALSLR